jgi:Asp-tRNA(Asn)/Glu-tRNA(Gln) amidotransferase A subunit family amidase
VKLIPLKVPDINVDASGFNVESGAFFDELIRTGRDKQMTNPGRAASFRSSRIIPAVEYLQGQRARAMMMMKLAEAIGDVDVYLVPANAGGGGGGRGTGGRGAGAGRGTGAGRGGGAGAPDAIRRQPALGRHFNMANIAGYPAVSVPNGFTETGSPTAITFYGKPFADTQVLELSRAYQDLSGHHLKRPNLDAPVPPATA